MDSYIFSTAGWVHLIASILALITGTMILAMKKGTKTHIKIGYVYAVAMVVVVATAFMIYRLFGGWGIFHWAATLSGLTLMGGMVPAILRRPKGNWMGLHFSFMYWSVMGLYAAFVAETLVRIPSSPFLGMVGIGTALVMLAGGAYFYYRSPYWTEQFNEAAQ